MTYSSKSFRPFGSVAGQQGSGRDKYSQIVGRQLRIEAAVGYTSKCTGQVRLHRGYLVKVRRCDEYDTDRAFAIVLGWLQAKDGGKTMDSLVRLWKRAQRALRTNTNRARLAMMVEYLEENGMAGGGEVMDLIR